MKRLTALINRLVFPTAPAARPAALRIAIGIYCFWYLAKRYRLFIRIAGSDPVLFRPVGVVAPLERPVPVSVFRAVLVATLLANIAFILGWKHRASGPAFSALLLWLLSYRNSWSMIYHNDNALVLHALILGFSPAADALSLDAVNGRAEAAVPLEGQVTDDWRYGWPVQLMNMATVLTYFVSGVAKIAGPLGWGWASGEGMRAQVAVDGLRKELLGERASPLAFALHDKLALYRILGIGSLAIELGAPLALADRRLGRLWALGACSMHWGILAVMGIKFRYQLVGLIFLPFFVPERIVHRLCHWLGR